MEAQVETGRFRTSILRVSVPSWDARSVGSRIRLMVDRNTGSIVEVDEFLYRHRTSLSLLAALGLFASLLIGVSVYRRR